MSIYARKSIERVTSARRRKLEGLDVEISTIAHIRMIALKIDLLILCERQVEFALPSMIVSYVWDSSRLWHSLRLDSIPFTTPRMAKFIQYQRRSRPDREREASLNFGNILGNISRIVESMISVRIPQSFRLFLIEREIYFS